MPEEKQQAGLSPIDYGALRKSVFDYDKLQSQYGGKQFSSKGATYSRDAYNEAWKDYQQENPNADKKNFRNIYTTDVEDEANITPWQVRAREDLEHSAALAAQEKEDFRNQQAADWKNLDPTVRQKRGMAALKGIRDMKSLKSDDLRKLAARKGKDYLGGPEITDEEFGQIQNYLESRQGTAGGDESNALLQAMYAPIKRWSPLKQIDAELVGRSAAAGMNTLGGLRAGIDAYEAEQKAAAEEERRQFQDQMRKMQYADMMAKQQEGLIIPGDTGINQADVAINTASRQLVDQAASLTAQLNNGDITPDEWASQTATIRSQVPALKTFKDTLQSNMAAYQQALQNGDLSAAMDPQADDLYGSLLRGDGAVQLGIDPETGQVTFGGTTAGGEEVSIPVSGIAQMPKPILKVADPYESLKGPFGELAAAQSELTDEQLRTKSEEILGNLLPTDPDAQNKALLSYAVDRFGLDLADAKEMLMSQDEDGANPLSEFVKDKFAESARVAFEAQAIERKKQEAYIENQRLSQQATEQRMDIAQQQNSRQAQQHNYNIQALKNAEEDRVKQEEWVKNNREAVQNFVINIPTDDPASMAAELSAIGAPIVWDKKAGFVVMKNGKPAERLGMDPNTVKRWAARALGQNLNTPTKRLSPFQRLNKWFNNLGK